ncbi:MAG: xanthine dehydrogenase family protein molybdopterin-binding subunit [Chloroflexi bacterium]|nr:xanthine dehydrogenase family protein molybdopterin-binding subunit [Chloroflexota bacterium]
MNTKLNRRDFLKLMAVTTGGLVIAVYLDGCAPPTTPQPVTATQVPATPTPEPPFAWEPNIYLKVDVNGTLTIIAFRSEMGQGIRTALAMLAADELDIDWSNVRIEQAPADSRYGDQVTGGSVSISGSSVTVRRAGATARQMLVNAAAQTWGVDATQCRTASGKVIHPDGEQKLTYGSLVETAAKLEIPEEVTLKEKEQFNIIGTGLGHWDAPKIVTGQAVFGSDVRLPGMFFAAIARCPVFGGTFTSYDDSAAKAVPGVKQVIELDDRIAVVAQNSWAAIQGRNALKVTWDEGKNDAKSSENFTTLAVKSLTKSNKTNPKVLSAVYTMPYEAHATMEPMNCTAYYHDDICEVWAPSQSPQDAQSDIARVTALSTDKVIVNVPLIGGGFGRRHQTDFAVEAAQLSKAINAPVKVVWTRDDDLQHDFYQPLSVQYFEHPLDQKFIPGPRTMGGFFVPEGAWRSVQNFPQAYGVQCFIDELAVALKRDPLDLRLEFYKDERALAVIELAAEKAGWGTPLPAGQGRGIAYHATFGVTHVCDVAEVSVDENGNVRVNRVVCAVDCGQVVNPDNVAAQMEGGIVFGLTAALKAESVLKNGQMQESNFHEYPILRMDEMPLIEVYIIESDNKSSGIGEMGVPPIAPAVANAIFAATGKRVRHIPIRPADLKP